jgi:hypothetical protein
LIFKTFNMPNLHEMNLKSAIQEWREGGHMMGTTKEAMAGDSSEASSQVARRHLVEKTTTFFFQVKRARMSTLF